MTTDEQLLVALCLLAKENRLHQLTYKSDGVEISFQMSPEMWEDTDQQEKELTEEELDDIQDKEDKESMFYCSG